MVGADPSSQGQVDLVVLMPKPIYFSRGIPSNWYEADIEITSAYLGKWIVVPTNEHYFQAEKVALMDGGIDAYREILEADTPNEAKRLGRAVEMNPSARAVWDESEALVAMLECNLAKFSQHTHCLAWLRKTGTRPLVEHRRDKIWGDGLDGSGRNLQGKILELVRSRLC